MFTVLCRRLSVSLWRCSSVPFRLISRCLSLDFSLCCTVPPSFSFSFPFSLTLFFLVLTWKVKTNVQFCTSKDLLDSSHGNGKKLGKKITACKKIASSPHIRMSWNATDVRTAHAPANHSACHDRKKLPACLLSMSMGLHSCGLRPQRICAKTMKMNVQKVINPLTITWLNISIYLSIYLSIYIYIYIYIYIQHEINLRFRNDVAKKAKGSWAHSNWFLLLWCPCLVL